MGAVASGGAEGGGKIADWWSGTGKPAVQSAGRGLSTAYGAIASGQVGNGLNQFSAGLGGVSQGLGSVSTAGANLVNTAQVARAQVANALKSGRGEPMTADDRHSLEFAISKLQGMLDAEGVDGGCECRGGFFGGAMEAEPSEGLASYAESASARMKESVVSGIGAALKDAGMAIDTSSPERIVASIAAAVPDPRGKPLFSADREKQAKACKILASVLNAQFTPGATRGSEKFVDDSGPPEEVCRQVGEWVHAFTLGVNTEFLAVHASVRNAMEQVQVLLKLLEVARKRVQSGVKAREDPALDQETGPAFELLTKSESEMKRLIAVLSNILHVNLGEAEDALKFARDDEGTGSRAIRALIKRAGVAGTPAFAKGLGAAVAGLGGAADVAHRVHLALKAVGISVGEFLGNRSFTELKREVHRRQEAGELPVAGTTVPPAKGDPAALVVKALDLIEKSLGDFRMGDSAPEYAAALRADAPGPREVWTGAGEALGGADPALADQLYGLREPKPYESRDKREKIEKQLLVRDFAKRMADRSAAVVTAVQALAPKLGAEVPLSDRTEALAEAVRRLPMSTATGTRMELALLGFGLDAAARMQKDAYLAALRAVSGACADLVESGAGGRAFGELKSAVDELVRTLDFFADTVAKKYGAAEAAPAAGAGKPAVAGGADEELDLVKALPPISRAGLSLPEAVYKFQYAYYTARVKENLSRSSAELSSYGSQYEDLLGRAVASKLQDLEAEETKINTALAALGASNAGTGIAPDGARYSAGVGTTAAASFVFTKAHCENLVKRNKAEFAAKRKFYKALQAMDLYMKAFTAGLAKDPAAVRDAISILDETQTIAKWFSDMTGEHIWKAFEALPGDAITVGNVRPGKSDFQPASDTAGHLFTRTGLPLAAASAAGTQAGCPLKGVHLAANDASVPENSAQKAVKRVSDAIDAFQGLKNLVNTFARVGSSFGGKDLKSLVFMSPAQIYTALTEFLKMSALSASFTGLVGRDAAAIFTALGAAPPVPGFDLGHGNIEGPNGVAGIVPVDTLAVPPGALHFGMVDDASGRPYEGHGGNFVKEDGYFVMIVKSMAAKVLTTLGVYDMFIREHPRYELTPARMIMGGGDDGTPEVFEGAAELYCRLPRLAEFYSSILKWGANDPGVSLPGVGAGQTTAKIALVPDLDGVFSGLIRQVFRRTAGVSSGGDYSDTELAAMVKEINRIFEHFQKSHPENTAREVFAAFVIEVNRRYGIVKQEEKNRYWQLVRDTRMMARTEEYPGEADTNYAILPGEEDVEATRAAPSDRYFAASASEGAAATSQSIKLDDEHELMIKAFRANLDEAFSSVGGGPSASYALLVKQAAAEMRRLRSPEERFAVAARLIQTTSVSGVDSTKAMMFHETVMVGLNVLSVHQQMLVSLRDRLSVMDPVAIERYLRRKLAGYTVAAGAVVADVDGDAPRPTGLVGNAAMGNGEAALGITANTKYIRYINREGGATASELIQGRSGAGGALGAPQSTGAMRYRNVYQTLSLIFPVAGAAGGAAGGGLSVDMAEMTIEELRKEAPGDNRTWCEKQHLVARLLTNYEQIMVDFLEHVFAVSGPLIEPRFSPEGGIRLNFSKLRSELESIMAVVRQYYDQFRPYLDDKVVKRFEDKSVPGSIAWVSKNLFDEFLLGDDETRGANIDSTGLERLSRQVQTVFANLVRDTGISLTGVTGIPAIGAGAAGAANFGVVESPPPTDTTRREWFGNVFARLVHYDAQLMQTGALAASIGALNPPSHVFATGAAAAHTPVISVALTDTRLIGLIGRSTTRAGGGVPPVVERPQANALNALRLPLYLADEGETAGNNRSLLFSFNQLVARFLATFIDGAGERKIYLNLINAFANGTVGMSVQDPARSAFPDLCVANISFGARGDPKSTAVLFQSLAFVLQRMVKDVGRSGEAAYTEPSLTGVPIYMKESMRANLPGFIKLFETLARKCDFIKRAFQQTGGIRLDRPSQLHNLNGTTLNRNGAGAVDVVPTTVAIVQNANGALAINDVGIADANFVAGSFQALNPLTSTVLGSELMKARLATIIDSIAGGCATLATSSAECLKELGDAPVFCQTGDGSIEQYRARNEGALPLMPLSLAFRFLLRPKVNQLAADHSGWGVPAGGLVADADLWPMHIMGTAEFKLAYGTRQLLAQGTPVGADQLPGVKAMLDAYNGVTARREQIEEAGYLKFVQSVVAALRQAVDTRRYRAVLAPVEIAPAVADPFVATPGAPSPVLQGKTLAGGATAVFALDADAAPDAQAVVTFVESTDQEGNRKKIADQVGGGVGASGDSGRKAELYANLIDLNIMPINLHALMRGIPLANLYNYAYTYDQYIASMYGKQASIATSSTPTDTTTMFLRLLSDPFLPVSWEQYGSDTHSMGSGGFVHRMFRGDNGLGMGRPKFLSDQLANKALYISIYQDAADLDEGGPAVGIGRARGDGGGPGQQLARLVVALNAAFVELGRLADTRVNTLAANLGAHPHSDRTAGVADPVTVLLSRLGNAAGALGGGGGLILGANPGGGGGAAGYAGRLQAAINGDADAVAASAAGECAQLMRDIITTATTAASAAAAAAAVAARVATWRDMYNSHSAADGAQGAGLPTWLDQIDAVLRRIAVISSEGVEVSTKFIGRLISAVNGALDGGVLDAVLDAAGTALSVAAIAQGLRFGDGSAPISPTVGAALRAAVNANVTTAVDHVYGAEWWRQCRAVAAGLSARVARLRGAGPLAGGPGGVGTTNDLNVLIQATRPTFVFAQARSAAAGDMHALIASHDIYSSGGGNAPGTLYDWIGAAQLSDLTAHPGFLAVHNDIVESRNPGTTRAPPHRPMRASKISYLRATGDGSTPVRMTRSEVVEVPVPFEVKMKLETIGKLRFDTRFVRKLMFITNVNRLLRLKLQRELLEERRAVVGSIRTLAPGVTEYGQDPFGANDVYESETYAGEHRFPSTRSGF